MDRRVDWDAPPNKGREEGARQEAARVLLKLLEARFGAPPERLVSRIQAADHAALDRWLERGFTASSLEQLFGH